ncbi:hypothetical protein P691DRAFT_666938 [Macrolepiota fuliginosa MF-IS2]|uniref:DUF6534 domain-containing protein n=1 Tax=Macrolepiota fuliginosa MF-IS2 TaxID=1400762 RepID=A0A9P6C5U4_9AGAR|nr:hypothetical protein P691DRAFT_666938 [Macrolepiota fuliginosa MF-IS2]
MALQVNVPTTFGALLLGGLYASILSGAVVLQVIIYFKIYDGDPTTILVTAIKLSSRVLDVLHTALVWAGLWNYLIEFFGQVQHIDVIPWYVYSCDLDKTLGILTFSVHCFFSHRIFMLSRRNWLLVIPIVCPSCLPIFNPFSNHDAKDLLGTVPPRPLIPQWLFTLGLALSTIVDILITGSLFFLLKTNRTSDFNLNPVIDTLILYAFEMGSFTTTGTIVSMICWLGMSNNLIFMGLHFVIAKCYANSLFVT